MRPSAQSKKKGAAGAKEQAEGRALQDAIRKLVQGAAPLRSSRIAHEFERLLDNAAARKAGVEAPGPRAGRPSSPLSPNATRRPSICRDKDGNPEPDPELRDTESVPLAERVEDFFEREVRPHVS